MKKLKISLIILTIFVFANFVNAQHFTESFENPDTWSGYTSGTVNFDSGDWYFLAVFPESSSASYDGSKACRINDDVPDAAITSPPVNGVGTVSFYYHRPFSGTGSFELQKSVGGGSFSTLATVDYSSVTTPTQYTYDVNDASNDIRIRIVNDDNTAHLTIDYFTMGTYSGSINPPSITSISNSPSNPGSSDAVSVSAEITDNGSISGAEIHWGTSSGSLGNTISMSNSGGNTYTTDTDIPAQSNGTTVYYEVYALDNDAEETTSAEQTYYVFDPVFETIPYSFDFSSDPFTNDWIKFSVSGSQEWTHTGSAAQMNAYSGSCQNNDDYLITPAFDLNSYSNEQISFTATENYGDSDLEVLYSTDYSGFGDPTIATWNTIMTISSTSTITNNSTLSSVSGSQVYIAFRYLYPSGGSGCSEWTIDDFQITGTSGSNLPPSISTISQSPSSGINSSTTVSVSADVTDSDGTLDNVELHWGITSGSLSNTISMSNSGGNTYTTDSDIPSQSNLTTVFYEIYAVDNDSDATTSTELSYDVIDPATIPYNEDFTGQNNKGATGGSPVSYDLSGVDWTLTINESGLTASTDWFRVESEEFSARDIDEEQIWNSPLIDISGYLALDISIDVSSVTGELEASDYIETGYILDGGAFNSIQVHNGEITGTVTDTEELTGLSTSTLKVVVKVLNGAGAEYYYFDNISVTVPVVDDPSAFTSTAFSSNQINLAATANGSNDDILVAYNSSSSFGTPATGSAYVAGNSIPGGGTVLYSGTAGSLINHTGLSAGQTVYYKAWSVDGSGLYSSGITDNATTTTTPVIVLSTPTLSGFNYSQGNGPSSEQTFTVAGSNLTTDITLSAPTNYEISTTSGSGYGSSLNLTPTGGTVSSAPIYVRLKSGLSANTYNGEDVVASALGASSQTLTCNGEVTCPGLVAPVVSAGTSVTSNSFTANWNAVTGADGYYLDVYSISGGTDMTSGGVGSSSDPLSVSQALALPESSTDYFVKGYIVGRGNPITFGVPAANDYSVLLAENQTETNPANVIVAKVESADRPSWGLSSNPVLYQTGVKVEGFRDNYGGDPSIEGAGQWEALSSGVPAYHIQNFDVGNVTSYNVAGLTPGTIYFYVVRAYNSCGSESANSNEEEVDLTVFGTNWTGAVDTDWNNAGNWLPTVVPNSGTDVTIPGGLINYPVVGSSSSADCNNITINSGASLTIESGGSFINNGTITNNGTMTAELFATGGSLAPSDYTWHSIGLPIASMQAGTNFLNDYVYTYDEANNGWNNIVPANTIINSGIGHIVKTISGDKTYSFTGTMNSGAFAYPVTNTGADAAHGYNFVANPYPSYLDLEEISGTNTGNTVWVWDPVSVNYLTYQIGTGAGALGQYLHPMQGFFVKVNAGSSSGTLNLENADRVHNSSPFYKSTNSTPDRIVMTANGNGFEDHLFIQNTNQVNDGYNLSSMNPSVPQLYVKDQNDDFCIYNMPTIPTSCVSLGFECDVAGNYSINVEENDFDAIYDLILEDNKLGSFTPLTQGGSYDFNYSPADDNNRFCLHFFYTNEVETVAVPDYIVKGDRANIFINTYADISDIQIIDINGKIIENLNDRSGEINIPVYAAGIYIVKINSDNKSQINKVVVTK